MPCRRYARATAMFMMCQASTYREMIRYPASSPCSGSYAPRDMDDGLASSPANIDRDQGVGYASCSIRSISSRSESVRRRISRFIGQPSANERVEGVWGTREIPPRWPESRGLAGGEGRSCSQFPLGVGRAEVDRLRRLRRTEGACKESVMSSPGHVDGAFVRRHERSRTLEDVAIPHGAVAHGGLTRLELEPVRVQASVLPRHEREDLPPPRIEDRAAPGAPRGERIESRDPGHRNAQ